MGEPRAQKQVLSVGRGVLRGVGCSSTSQDTRSQSRSVPVSVPLMPSEASCVQVCMARSPWGWSPHQGQHRPPNWGRDPRPKEQDPRCLLQEGSTGAPKGTLAHETLGLQFASKGLITCRLPQVSFLPFSRYPALCTLTRGSGPGCSDQLSEEHGPASAGSQAPPKSAPSCLAAVSPEQVAEWLLVVGRPSQATWVPVPSLRAPPPGSPRVALSAASGQPTLPQENPDPAP